MGAGWAGWLGGDWGVDSPDYDGGEVRPQPQSTLLGNQPRVAACWLQLEGHKVNTRLCSVNFLTTSSATWTESSPSPPLSLHVSAFPPVLTSYICSIPKSSLLSTPQDALSLPVPTKSPQALPEAFFDSSSASGYDSSPSPGATV